MAPQMAVLMTRTSSHTLPQGFRLATRLHVQKVDAASSMYLCI